MSRLILSCVFLFAATYCCAQQGFYVEAGDGYNFAPSKTNYQTKDALTQPWYNGTYNANDRFISFGKGLIGTLKLGYAAKNGFVDYAIGFQYQQFPYKKVENIKVKTDTSFESIFTEYRANSLRVMPEVIFKKYISRYKLRPFLSFGLPISFNEVEITRGSQKMDIITIEDRTYYPRWVSLGLHLGIGMARNISSRCQLSISADYTALNFLPHKVVSTGFIPYTDNAYHVTSYTKTGDSIKDYDMFVPLHFSAIGLKIGFRYFFNKATE